MKSKGKIHLNIGGASILLILVIFSLTIFAMLSFRASYHEMKLAQKNNEAVQRYYEADAKAETYMQLIDSEVKKQKEHGTVDTDQLIQSVSDTFLLEKEENSNNLTYNVIIDYNRYLKVTIQLPNDSENNINVTSWRMISTEEGDYGCNVDQIWDGMISE